MKKSYNHEKSRFKIFQKKYKRKFDLEKAIKQNVIKKTNANADWLKKHLIVVT
tara:strand:- start:3445 stop:3603 length:159 start_codon:yes stop_codon:yes gene_type:complete